MLTLKKMIRKEVIAALLTAVAMAGCSREGAMSKQAEAQDTYVPMPAAQPSAQAVQSIPQPASPSPTGNALAAPAPSYTPSAAPTYQPVSPTAYAPGYSNTPTSPTYATPPAGYPATNYPPTAYPPTNYPATAYPPTAGAPVYQQAAPVYQQYVLSDQQLDQLMAPVALYPDPLLAVMLPASTFPSDLAAAASWLQYNPNPTDWAIDTQNWEPSVKALAHTPSVLIWMANNQDWTHTLGNAFTYQPNDVMDSVQRLRGQAVAAGALADTPQQDIVYEANRVLIVPADPQIIYVPVYDWNTVYYRDRHPTLTFFVGAHVGTWFDYDCDWDDRRVVTGARWDRGWDHRWDHDRNARDVHVRDAGRPAVINNNTTVINNTRTVKVGGTPWQRDAARPAPALPATVKPARVLERTPDNTRTRQDARDAVRNDNNTPRRVDSPPPTTPRVDTNVNTRTEPPSRVETPTRGPRGANAQNNVNTRVETPGSDRVVTPAAPPVSATPPAPRTPTNTVTPVAPAPTPRVVPSTPAAPRIVTPDIPKTQEPVTPTARQVQTPRQTEAPKTTPPERGRGRGQNVAIPAPRSDTIVAPDSNSRQDVRDRVVTPDKADTPKVAAPAPKVAAPVPSPAPAETPAPRGRGRNAAPSESVVVPDATPRGADRVVIPDSESRGTGRATVVTPDRGAAADARGAEPDRGRGADRGNGNGRGRGNGNNNDQ